MRLTSFTDYSLRVLMFLATRPEHRATIAEIAAAFDISENHLMKVVHFLGREKLLTTSRGKNGGIALSHAPSAINLGRVVRIAETSTLPAECFDRKNNRCVITPVCQLKGVLMEAVKAFNTTLDRYTLADVTGNRQELTSLLFSKPAPRAKARATA